MADTVGNARHIVVAPNGTIYAAINDPVGGVIALRDGDGNGTADQRARFGAGTGTGIGFFDGHIYFASDTSVVRWHWDSNALVPPTDAETIVTGLELLVEHRPKAIAITSDGHMYLSIGAPSNACEIEDRPAAKGIDPCPLLEHSAGIWRFDARRPMQRFGDGVRHATGLRNVLALTVGPDSTTLWGVQHGRDNLALGWGRVLPVYTNRKSAENPAEELFRIEAGADYGWPYCYYDVDLKTKVLAPEYGGDGFAQGRCTSTVKPLIAFPAHWAPESMAFSTSKTFPLEFQGGAFVSFHGSYNRAPLPQAGFNVSYVPFSNGQPVGTFRVFADGFRKGWSTYFHRPMGLAIAPDGSLIVSDDLRGRIYRISYQQ